MALDASPLELKIRQLLGSPEFPDAGGLHILLMLILISYGEDGRDMRPSGTTLAYEASISRRQVTRLLLQLEAWHFIVATQREDRKPVVWEIGKALKGEPQKDHTKALDRKRLVLEERERQKPEPNPEKTIARAIKSFQKHKPVDLVRQDDELQAEVVVLPYEVRRIAQEVIDDVRPSLPKTGEWRVTPEAVETKRHYASFAAKHTREDDVDAAA